MAAKKTPARRRGQNRPSAVSLTQLTILDAIRGWVVPALTAPAALVVYVLESIEVLQREQAVTALGLLALVTVAWTGLRGFITEQTSRRLAALLAIYTVVWLAATAVPFHAIVAPGAPLFSATLHGQESASLPVEGHAGRYRLVVEGAFAPTAAQGDRRAHYRLALAAGETTQQVFEGDFIEQYLRQRLGRRGSTTVRSLHTAAQYDISNPDGRALRVSLSDLAPADVVSSVTVKLFVETFPMVAFAAVGVLLVIGAMVVDAWRPRDQSEGLLTTLTLSTLLTITGLRWYGGPAPGFGQLAVQALLGAVVGSVATFALTRLVRPLLRRLPAAP